CPAVIPAACCGVFVARLAGALAAPAGVFLPVYLLVLAIAPYFRRISKQPRLRAAVEGGTAGATGAIAGAVFVLGRRAVHHLPTAIIAIVTLAIISLWRVPEPVIIGGAALAGLFLYNP